MALQWLVLSYVVAAEAAVAILVTLPTPKLLRDRLVYFVSLILQPALFIVPFAGFQLVDIQSSEKCGTVHCSLFSLLVYLPHMQVPKGPQEFGGSGEEVQVQVASFCSFIL
ncbi:uncharacterized protein LOC107644099 isoform X3 [Arachis ipaensis]|uniref:uncharacterized protein LOC107644099 isoform X3 n=1 Tax=Arachis ipaensis TaxID=130454 RepID=UPI000A2B6A93|nr:uncharacterized protein LOC107644099 isoform X3 [Arachis ipaensis]